MKKFIYTILALAGGVILSTLLSTETVNLGIPGFEQEPPIVKNIFVQKIETPGENGNNLNLCIEYHMQENLTISIDLFLNGNVACTVKDDGDYPDVVKDDGKYTASLNVDINNFTSELLQNQNIAEAQGGLSIFEGHVGRFVGVNEIELFDLQGFNNNEYVQVYQPILNISNCENAILKQNSLFITDLSVVEDPARTRNVFTNDGNGSGAWTFEHLMKNKANTSVTDISTKDFINN